MDSKAKKDIDVKNNFLDRQKHLNAQLEQIEKSLNKHRNHTDSPVPRLEELSRVSRSQPKIKGYRGRQSIFKRPEGPAPKSNVRVIPDYRKNPSKWTYYSLEDVSEMSNESNQQAAFDFLRELEQRKQKKMHKLLANTDQNKNSDEDMDIDNEHSLNNSCMDKDSTDSSIILFKKLRNKKETSGNDVRPQFQNNKLVMPEYEVGTKKISKKKNIQKACNKDTDKCKEVKLDHLFACDDGKE